MTKTKSHPHTCQAVVVTCIDFRFQKMITDWIGKNIKNGYDRVAVAGSIKNLLFLVEQITLSHQLHHIKEVHLINHEDCGAYGKEGNFEKHKEDLLAAEKTIQERFPELKVFLYYLKFNGEFVKIR